MFFAPERLPVVQRMILATNEEDRKAALKELLPFQRADFFGLFDVMKGKPVTIRTLDPPLHEFLPKREELMVDVALGKNKEENEKLLKRVNELHEFNPMMGLRGCRLGIVFPEITAMQAEAIFEAALDVGNVVPEVMIPLIAYRREFDILRAVIVKTALAVEQETGAKLDYQIGTMIELPRAALKADDIASGEAGAEFFSFGTNDLTQTCLGLSRDDAAPILANYAQRGVFEVDPFVSIDQGGVGELVRMGTERGRKARPGLKVGICGEHGGDPASIGFCHQAGLDYVSCSPFRVPVARLAAAQAAIKAKGSR